MVIKFWANLPIFYFFFKQVVDKFKSCTQRHLTAPPVFKKRIIESRCHISNLCYSVNSHRIHWKFCFVLVSFVPAFSSCGCIISVKSLLILQYAWFESEKVLQMFLAFYVFYSDRLLVEGNVEFHAAWSKSKLDQSLPAASCVNHKTHSLVCSAQAP